MSADENNHMASHTGTCLCGGVSFVVKGQPNAVFCCYCGDCSKGAGGPCQITASYYSSNFELKDPYRLMTQYTISDTVSGLPKEKGFCGRCGCTLFTIPATVFATPANDEPEEIVIRVALIQNGLEMFEPTIECFTKNRPAYLSGCSSARQYNGMA